MHNEITINICKIIGVRVWLLALSLIALVVFSVLGLTVLIVAFTLLVGGVVGIADDGDGNGDVLLM